MLNGGTIQTDVSWSDIAGVTDAGAAPHVMGKMVAESETINPMAKYKPVRHSSVKTLTLAERRSTRHGFSVNGTMADVPTWAPGQTVPKADWVYRKPRGGSYNEWFRGMDFLSAPGSLVGYNAFMCAPITVMPGGSPLVGDDYGVVVFVDTYAASVQEGKTWNAEAGLTVEELLSYPASLFDYYVCFLFVDNTDPASFNYVHTNTTMRALAQAGYKVFEFRHQATGNTPAVPFLNDSSHNGHDVTIIAGLSMVHPSAGDYSVSTQYLDTYSLGFVDGCDRCVVKFGSAISILGLEGEIVNNSTHPITLSNPTSLTYGGYRWVRYNIPQAIWGSFHTPATWNRGAVYLDVMIDNMTGMIGTATEPGDTGGTLVYSGSFGARVGEQTFLVNLATVSEYFWMLADVPVHDRGIIVSLRAHAYDTGEYKTLNGVTVYATS